MSTDELTLTLYPIKEPKTSINEPTLTLFSYPIVVSFLLPIEDNISANKLGHTIYMKLIMSKKRLNIGLKTISKNLRYSTSTSS